MTKKIALILLWSIFSFALQANNIEQAKIAHWNELCDKNLYMEVVNDHYDIMYNNDAEENSQAAQWRRERLAKKFEFAIAWIHRSYLNNQVKLKKVGYDPIAEVVLKLDMKMYIKARIDGAVFGHRGYLHVLPILELLQQKIEKNCLQNSLPHEMYETWLKEVKSEMTGLHKSEKIKGTTNGKKQRTRYSFRMSHPAVIMKTFLRPKSLSSYLPTNWYRSGIEIKEEGFIEEKTSKDIYKAQGGTLAHAVQDLGDLGVKVLYSKNS